MYDEYNTMTFIFRWLRPLFEKQAQDSPSRDQTFFPAVPRGCSIKWLHANRLRHHYVMCHFVIFIDVASLIKTVTQNLKSVLVTGFVFSFHIITLHFLFMRNIKYSLFLNSRQTVLKLPHVSRLLFALWLSRQFLWTVCQLLLRVITHKTSRVSCQESVHTRWYLMWWIHVSNHKVYLNTSGFMKGTLCLSYGLLVKNT